MNLPPELVETLLTRCSAQILESHGFQSADRAGLFALNRIVELYLNTTIQRSLAFARANKRLKVNYDDIELSFFMESISLGALEDELMRLNNGEDSQLNLTQSQDKVARGFESIDKKIQANLLGPELNGRARGVPDYMEKGMMLPNLPPLHTHHKTPVYPDRIQDALQIRRGVTEQSTLVEQSVCRLIEIEESSSGNRVKQEEDMDEDIEMDDERVTDVMLPNVPATEQARRKRERMFEKVWSEMGYGEAMKGRSINWEDAPRTASSFASRKVALT